ncbi:hypothetical protein FRB93_008941 [Tulasnella sp. JGI-2019a]|nr:hypothetical protein FRB93_008941 [Tulasnella sp. JGI-2019a]
MESSTGNQPHDPQQGAVHGSQTQTVAPRELPSGAQDWLGVPNLRNHLSLLKLFRTTCLSIDGAVELAEPTARDSEVSPQLSSFYAKAVYRFETWIRTALRSRQRDGPLVEEEIPPPDVLILLQGYMLSPWLFAEDSELRFPELGRIGPFPLHEVVAHINAETGSYKSTLEQIAHWEKQTGLPFDALNMKNETEVVCPSCHNKQATFWIKLQDGTGYAEPGFALDCECGLHITHDALCVSKLVQDLVGSKEPDAHILRGTLFGGASGSEQRDIARMTTREVVRVLGDPIALGREVSWSMNNVIKRLKEAPDTSLLREVIPKLLRPYSQPSPFSVNLPFKALRQAHFAHAWASKGWFTESPLTPAQTRILEDAISGYRVFLRYVPTKDAPTLFATEQVDLVWHTHQLLGGEYRKQLINFCGKFFDHLSMDEIEPTADVVAGARKAWKDSMIAEGTVPPPDPCKNCPDPFCIGCDGVTYGGRMGEDEENEEGGGVGGGRRGRGRGRGRGGGPGRGGCWTHPCCASGRDTTYMFLETPSVDAKDPANGD